MRPGRARRHAERADIDKNLRRRNPSVSGGHARACPVLYGRQTNLTYARPRRRPASAGPVARGGAARGTEVPDVRRNLAVITYPAGARF